jgi:hypothetical protein
MDLDVLAVTREEYPPVGEVDALAGGIMHPLNSFGESRGEMAV